MFRSKIAIAIASLFVVPSISHAISLTDYDVPTSHWDEAYLVGSGIMKSGNQDQSSYNYKVGANYASNYTSPMQNWRILIDGDADVSRGANDGDKRTSDYKADAGVVVENYLNEGNNTFWFGDADVGVRKDADNARIRIRGGIGYGRLIHATPLANALSLVDELRDYGIVRGDLSRDAYIRLAQVIDRESEFKSVHGLEEYEAHWYQAMEAVLRESGVLTRDGVGADGALHMRRVLVDEPAFTRIHGWDVRAGVGYLVRNYDGDKGDPTLGAQFRYAMPIGLLAQFLNTTEYNTVLADDTNHEFMNRMSYTVEVSSQMDWINSWRIDHTRYGESNRSDFTRNRLFSGIEYHITNQVTADLGVEGIKRNDGGDWDLTTRLNLIYRLK